MNLFVLAVFLEISYIKRSYRVGQSLITSNRVNRITVEEIDVICSNQNHENAILYIHGFPGPYETLQPGTLRVADQLFDYLSSKFDFYYPLYTIKQSFSLLNSLSDCAKVLKEITNKNKYSSITLVGQSWGAVIALHLSSTYNFKKILLITPFLSIPKGDASVILVQAFCQQYPGLLPPETFEKVVNELITIGENDAPIKNIKNTKSDIIIFASEKDEVVPLPAVRAVASVNEKAKIIVLSDQSHSIENRNEFLRIFQNEII